MNWMWILMLSLLLSACGCRYNGIDTRDILVSPSASHASFDANDESIDVTDERIRYVR